MYTYSARKDTLSENIKQHRHNQHRRAQLLPTTMIIANEWHHNRNQFDILFDDDTYMHQDTHHVRPHGTNRSETLCECWYRYWNVKYRHKAKRIDVLARICFPIAFIVFNGAYWWRYLRPYMSDEYDQII
jgi:hypothetical protein